MKTELPESLYSTSGKISDVNSFTRNQLREYGQACYNEALEDVANAHKPSLIVRLFNKLFNK